MYKLVMAAAALLATHASADCVVDGVDLATAVGRTEGFTFTRDKYTYYINVCREMPDVPTGCANQPDIATCQYDPTIGLGYEMGAYHSAMASKTGTGYTVQYPSVNSVGVDRQATLEITCAKDATPGITDITEGLPGITPSSYTIKITSPCKAVPGGGASTSDDGGWSFGDVMCLLVPLFLALYFVGGFIYLKFVAKKESIGECIIHKDFWMAIPGLVIDGCRFIRTKACGDGTTGGATAGSDYDRL